MGWSYVCYGIYLGRAWSVYITVPPTSTDLSVFLRILRTNYGQKVKNTDAKNAPEGVASITVSGGLERYTEISRKIRRLRSLPTGCCKVDLEVLILYTHDYTKDNDACSQALRPTALSPASPVRLCPVEKRMCMHASNLLMLTASEKLALDR